MSLYERVAEGYSLSAGSQWRSMPALPSARDFLTSAGFGGLAAVVAAIILALIAYFAARRATQRDQLQLEQQERQHQENRADEQRAAAVSRCWQRLVWVVETAGLEPAANEHATLGLGPELALELLRGLLRDAEQLQDDTLAKSVAVYLNQFSLVLAQQAGPLSQLTAGSSPRKETSTPRQAPIAREAPPARHAPPAREAPAAARHEQPVQQLPAPAPPATDEQPVPAEKAAGEPAEAAAEGRRRRR